MNQSKIKKLLKYVGLPMFALIVIYLIVVNFSATESNFKCTGQISLNGDTQSKTVYIKLTQYRSWVGLWSDSKGNVRLEIPNEAVIYYSRINKTGDMFQIYRSGELAGNFSKISKSLMIQADDFGIFDGSCVVTD